MSQILESVKLNGALVEIIARSNGENVKVNYNGKEMTLAAALTEIFTSVSGVISESDVDEKIGTAISGLINGAPETYDTLKEIADYISSDKTAMQALNDAIGNKVTKEEGKGLSAEDFTTALKTKLENMPDITASDVEKWNAKADTSVATSTANGLMSKEDKARLDGIRGVRYGTEPPADMQDGEMFIKVVAE